MREGEGVGERDDEVARLASMLEAVQARLDELSAVVAALDPDRVAQTRAIAEDGLARADHALAVAGDAVARADSAGADALARADHSLARAADALARAESLGADALARADHAAAVAGDAVARAESSGADALARADHATAMASDAVARMESLGADALARADHATAVAGDAVARAESSGADALARADHAAAMAGDAVAHAESSSADAVARAESLGADALARADHAAAVAGDAVAQAESSRRDALARADHAAAVAGDAVARVESSTADALARADHALARAEDALTRANDAVERADSAAAASEFAVQAVHEAMLPARVAAFAEWLQLRPPVADVTVSVVLPTRDRPEPLPRAIASVLAQRYERWELVVVDDGDTDAVERALADADDERVVTVEGPRRGLGAARNAGLDAATGDVVCYLDDDNVMHPDWLRAVVHVFAGRDDVEVLYGVTIAEHRLPDTLATEGWWPAYWQLPWSRETLLRENLTDAGALAHRRELPEARFDEELSSGEDWDLLIRLTAKRPALAVPALAHAYTHEGDDRMSRAGSHRAELEDVRRRHAGD